MSHVNLTGEEERYVPQFLHLSDSYIFVKHRCISLIISTRTFNTYFNSTRARERGKKRILKELSTFLRMPLSLSLSLSLILTLSILKCEVVVKRGGFGGWRKETKK